MADESLNEPVVIQSARIDATLLPAVFSLPYQLYVIQNGADFGAVANKANEAGSGAYDAQVVNDRQDITLLDHSIRISAAESTLTVHESRISTLENDVEYLQDAVVELETDVAEIKADYVSKSASTDQNVQSAGGVFLVGSITTPTTDVLQIGGSSNALVSYKVAGLKVVGARDIGWTSATGSALKGAFNSSQTFAVGTTYNQAQVTAIASGLIEARQRIKALEDMCRTHGLIN